MLMTAVTFGVLFALIYYVPGRIACSLFLDSERPEESFPFSIGLGVILVNVPAFLFAGIANLYAPVYLDRLGVCLTACAVTLSLALFRVRRLGWRPRLRLQTPSSSQVLLLCVTGLSFAFYLLHYDEDTFKQDSCAVTAATAVTSAYLTPELLALGSRDGSIHEVLESGFHAPSAERGRFLTSNQGQRTGPTVLIAPFVAVFGVFGYRLLFALQGLLLPGLGYVVSMHLFRRKWAAWLTAILLGFNPYSTSVQIVDENFLALTFGSLALSLILRSSPAPFLAGMALSVFLGVRHVGVLIVPFVLWYLWRHVKRPPRASLYAFAGICLFGLPYIIRHASKLLNTGVLLDGGMLHPPALHSFFGLEFDLRMLLSFPFVDEPLRSPLNAFPTIVAFPLDLVRRFGLIIVSLVPAGLVYLFREDRAKTWLLVMWFAPILALVMLQSNWTEPDKMGLPASVLLPAVLTITAGMVYMADTRAPCWQRMALIGFGLALPLAFYVGVKDYEAPVDERIINEELLDQLQAPDGGGSRILEENEAFVAWDRARYAPGLWPRLGLGQYNSEVIDLRLAQLADILARPSLRDFEGSFADYINTLLTRNWLRVLPFSISRVLLTGERAQGYFPIRLFEQPEEVSDAAYQDVLLKLNYPPVLSGRGFVPVRGTSVIEPLRVDDGRVYEIWGVPVGWREELMLLLFARDHFGTIHVYSQPIAAGERPIEPPPWLPLVRIDGAKYHGGSIPLSLPEGVVIRLLHQPSYLDRRYLSYVMIESDGVFSSAAKPIK